MSIVRLDLGAGAADVVDASAADEEAAFLEALRRRAAESLERAYRFLETQSDDWALLRAQVLCEARPPADLARKLGERQGENGALPIATLVSGGGLGFPELDPARLDAAERGLVGTLEALLMAADARAMHADWVETAVRFVEAQQSSDGAFRVGSAAAAPDSDLFWTGMLGGVLGRTPLSRTGPLEAAGEFVAARFDPERVEHDGYPELLACAHFFTNVAHDTADEALQWCGRALEKGFRSRQLEAVATLRVLLTCDAQAMPGATFDAVELLDRLMAEQAGDGGFAELTVGGPARRTTQTFDAMLAIVRLCAALDSRAPA